MKWIDDDESLNNFIDFIVESDRYALDTEFHREKTYFPKLALLQIRVDDRTALIDPLAINPKLLNRLFEADVLCVLHAAQQDLEVLRHASLEAPKNIFDCQVAAGREWIRLRADPWVPIGKGDKVTLELPACRCRALSILP